MPNTFSVPESAGLGIRKVLRGAGTFSVPEKASSGIEKVLAFGVVTLSNVEEVQKERRARDNKPSR